MNYYYVHATYKLTISKSVYMIVHNNKHIIDIRYIPNQRPEVNGTLVAGIHEFPAMKLAGVNLDASAELVITR